MTINRQVKSNLAKLLATENLTVEHSNVPTASFDVQNRVLSLPIWENVSDDVYDLLVGHEVGHAIYTPDEWGDAYGIPQSYLNVVEDARIERLMKVKYPGLAKSFYRGYSELNKQDFFEIQELSIDTFSLIDRINLYFKIGIHDVSTLIPFADEESVFVEMTRNTESFSDVVEVCRKILEYVKQNRKQEEKVDITPPQNNQGPATSFADTVPTQDNSEQQEEGESEEKKESDGDSDETKQSSGGDQPVDNSEDFEEDVEESSTDKAWEKNQRKFVTNSCKEYVYITPPNVDWEKHVVPLKEFSADIDVCMKEISEKTTMTWDDKIVPMGQNWLNNWKESYNNFKQESNKAVSFLIKEFEMKKKANEYNRASTSKTGVLDTNKLTSYKWSDDLFKKTSVIPTGKNHGLIMYIDWSGSMDDNLEGTIKQLINLVVFCKKVQIPYQVFAFVDNGNSCYEAFDKCETHREISVLKRFKLVEMFNSSLNTKELDQQILRVWNLMKCINYRYDIHEHRKYDLGSTPLNDTIFAAIHLFNQFKKRYNVDKINTVFLTDGESNALSVTEKKVDKRKKDEVYYTRKGIQYYYDAVVCLKDPKTGYMDHDITRADSWQESTFKVTARLMEYYKWMTNSTVVGFRLSKPGQATQIMVASKKSSDDETAIAKSWKNDKYFVSRSLGYDELYVIQLNDEYMGKVSEIKADHTSTANKLRNEFRKHVKSKMFNKIILSKFVDQIA